MPRSAATNLLVAYFAEHPPAISGELYIAPEWYEDAADYLPVWGAREFLIDGKEAFGRWDNLAISIDKRTGQVREDHHTPNFGKIKAMTPITRSQMSVGTGPCSMRPPNGSIDRVPALPGRVPRRGVRPADSHRGDLSTIAV